jgi:hypothetical protein
VTGPESRGTETWLEFGSAAQPGVAAAAAYKEKWSRVSATPQFADGCQMPRPWVKRRAATAAPLKGATRRATGG